MMVTQNRKTLRGSRRLAIGGTVAFGVALLAASMTLSVAGDVGRAGPAGARAVAATDGPTSISAASPCPLDAIGSRVEQPDTLVIGRDVAHRVCARAEAYWSSVYLHGGFTYAIETRRLSRDSDTQLTIYDPDGRTVLATDDDGGDINGASRIVVTATTSATYLLLVSRAKGIGTDQELSFDLRAT